MKKKVILLVSLIVVIGVVITIILLNRDSNISKLDKEVYSYKFFSSYDSYNDYIDGSNFIVDKELYEKDFVDKKYLTIETSVDSCSEDIRNVSIDKKDSSYDITFEVKRGCGVCPAMRMVYTFEVEDTSLEVNVFEKVVDSVECNSAVAYKPIIYIYPTEDIDLTIKLGNENLLTHTYPKYKDSWNVRVSTDSNIYDYDTKRNYYGLYWEGIDTYEPDYNVGFVVKGEDTVSFLEEKLDILGLSEREINEFIIYWIDKLESNKYNYISFRSSEYLMPLEFSKNPDTLIRVMMDFKALDSFIDVEEQELTKVERRGFTVVEWGGRIHK